MNTRALASFLIAILLLLSSAHCAEGGGRKGSKEILFFGQVMGGDSITGTSSYSNTKGDFEIAPSVLGGFGIGANLTDSLNVNLDINILRSRISPMLTAGLRFVNATDFGGGEPFQESDASYSFGGGIRCDFARHFAMKALFRFVGIFFEDADSAAVFPGVGVAFAYLYD